MRTGIGQAHGKIILIGEHAVVYSQPAIALPFNGVKVVSEITENDKLSVDCIYHTGLLKGAPEHLNNLKVVVKEVLKRLNKENETFNIKITSSIPQERGMGSSAAVANATVEAIYDYYGVELTKQIQFELAQVSEEIAHGNPSGLDAQVTVSNKPLYFVKDKQSEHIDIKAKGYLVVADTGEKGQTKLAVEALGKRQQQNPQRINEMIQGLGQLTSMVKDLLMGNDLRTIGNAMNQSQRYLDAMGISNSTLNHLISVSNQSGALGSKLTGGGWGGCMLALASDLNSANEISQALKMNAAKQTWLLAF